MKLIFLIVFLFSFGHPSFYVHEKCYTGYVFEKEHFVLMSVENSEERFTPSANDISLVENVLKKNIANLNIKLINQPKDFPVIHKNLKKYIRQYVGFINNSNEKIIWINFLWKNKYTKEEISKEIINIKDGGSYFWNIKINLQTGELTDFNVNGIG